MENKLSKRNWINIILFSFMGGIAWNVENMYFNTFLYSAVYETASESALANVIPFTTAASRMVALSAIAAVVTTFIMGTLSDKVRNRKVFISFGYIAWGIVTALFGLISKDSVASLLNLSSEAQIITYTVWAIIILDIVMTFMGSTSNDAAFNAWVTDITNPKIRPKVETALTFVGFLAMGSVMGVGTYAQSAEAGDLSRYHIFFIGLGVIVTLCGIAGLFLLENPPKREEKSSSNYWADLFYGFRPSVIRENSKLYLTLASACCFNVAFQVFFPFLLTYLEKVILPSNASINLASAGVIITAVAVVAALVGGIVLLMKLSGKSKMLGIAPGVICLAVGLFLLYTTTNIYGVLIGIAPTLIGYIVLGIQFNAAIKDYIPVGKAGLFQGIRMIFMVLIPMVVGPAIGDIACRNSTISYAVTGGSDMLPTQDMFLYSAIIAMFVFVPLFFLYKSELSKKGKLIFMIAICVAVAALVAAVILGMTSGGAVTPTNATLTDAAELIESAVTQ